MGLDDSDDVAEITIVMCTGGTAREEIVTMMLFPIGTTVTWQNRILQCDGEL
jgi:hypothetical protein